MPTGDSARDTAPGVASEPDLREMYEELDREYRAASDALAADDWDTWAQHAGRGAEIYERLAVLHGWRAPKEATDG